MGGFLRQHSLGVIFSVGMHTALVLALMVGFTFGPTPQPRSLAPMINAVMVDQAAIEREAQRLEALEQAEIRRQQEQERQAREAAERARQEQEREQQRAQDERQRLEQERVAREQEAVRERERLQQLAREREQAEQAARERDEAARVEAERLRQVQAQQEAEERRQREEAERRRQEEEARLAEQRRQEEARRQREEAERRQQAELEQQLQRELDAEAERMRAVQSGELAAYIRMIQARIEQNWNAPPGTPTNLNCRVNIVQIPSGDVVDVQIGQCNGSEAVIRSIAAAVERASPLPLPRVSSLFERNLNLQFCPSC